MSLERRRRRKDGNKGLEKGGLPGGALGVVADIPPSPQQKSRVRMHMLNEAHGSC